MKIDDAPNLLFLCVCVNIPFLLSHSLTHSPSRQINSILKDSFHAYVPLSLSTINSIDVHLTDKSIIAAAAIEKIAAMYVWFLWCLDINDEHHLSSDDAVLYTHKQAWASNFHNKTGVWASTHTKREKAQNENKHKF